MHRPCTRFLLGAAGLSLLGGLAPLVASAQSTCPNIVDGVDQCGYAGGAVGQLYDSDWDGLDDRTESQQGLNPNNQDSDGDGLSDGNEYYDVYARSDPSLYDTDQDGLSDGHEVFQSRTDPLLYDTDRDGAPDGADQLPNNPGVR